MIHREQVIRFLQEKQEIEGGYTGTDLTKLAEILQITSRGLNKRISFWKKTDKEFSQFIYLGKEKPPITLFEFFKIEYGLESNPIQVKKGLYDDIQEERTDRNKEPLAKSTFYRNTNQKILSMFGSYQDNWFKAKKITFPENYSLEKNRESLNTIFTFSDLKIYGGADIEGIYKRLVEAKKAFSIYNVDANKYYSEILLKRKFLKNLLSSIPPNQQLEVQAKLIFQIQASYIIECTDLLIVQLIHKHGRTLQSDNASRDKTENNLREGSLKSFRNEFMNLDDSAKIDARDIKKHSNVLIEEDIVARMKLLRKHIDAYRIILKLLNNLTNNMTIGVKFHKNEVKTVYKLATGELTWDKLNEQQKKSITWKPDLTKAIDQGNADVVPLIATSRLINYIRKGKITFDESYYFQDIGERLSNIQLNLNECYLSPEILDQLIDCTYSINGLMHSDIPTEEKEKHDDELPTKWNDLSDILREVSTYIRSSNPSWFKEHDELFKKQTDGLFWIEYTEEDFAKRLYDSIEFLGRNFRYRDSEDFFSLKYFIQRYISAATLILEFKFIHKCLEQLSNKKIECFVLDTMGIDARIKSIL